MALTALAPDRIDRLVAIDIAPSHVRRHDRISRRPLTPPLQSDATSRQQAAGIMRQHLNEEGVIQFQQNPAEGEWRFNVPVLWEQYPHIVGWETIPPGNSPAPFIPCGNRRVTEAYRDALLAQFLWRARM